MNNLYEEIEIEREKLIRLVSQAIWDNQPLGTNDVILAQSRKLDLLIGKFENQRKGEKQKENKLEHDK